MSVEDAGVKMAAMVRTMVEGLVDRPDDVAIVLGRDGRCVLLNVRVAPVDVGRVVGREGRTARSLRTIVDAVSQKLHVRCELNIEGDKRPSRERVGR